MSDEVLKGNFKVKKPVKVEKEDNSEGIVKELREKALASIGGSMVYMERTDFTWEGEEGQEGQKGQEESK